MFYRKHNAARITFNYHHNEETLLINISGESQKKVDTETIVYKVFHLFSNTVLLSQHQFVATKHDYTCIVTGSTLAQVGEKQCATDGQ